MQTRRLTREMKILLSEHGYDSDNYLWVKLTKQSVTFVNKTTGNKITLEREHERQYYL